jgi:predicted alpha/beta hydrolase family esterase
MMPPAVPLSPSIAGELFLYARGRAAFESLGATSAASATQHAPNKLILLGGLSDGFMPTPYATPLTAACEQMGWSVVQPILSSSYMGFGNGSLVRDSEELDELLQYLVQHRSCQNVCLVGHSTGCQQTVHYLKHGLEANREKVKVAVMQAPVSDREHAMTEPNYTKYLDLAKAMIAEGKDQEMMPREAFWAPITAQRLLDLHLVGGSDDFFSSDFSDEELANRLGHMGVNCPASMVAWSGSDEFVPETVNGEALMNRLASAMNSNGGQSAKGLFMPTGNHNLSLGPGDDDKFVAEICKLLKEVA